MNKKADRDYLFFRHIEDIRFEGTNEDIVWRSPIEDFDTGGKLTVFETQKALFYMNGACVGEIGPGQTILDTEHIPFLHRLTTRIMGTKTIFHATVYFVNMVEMQEKWGVGDISVQDIHGPVFKIGCHGQMNLAADNSRKIVEKLLGTQVRSQAAEKLAQQYQAGRQDGTAVETSARLSRRDVSDKFNDLIAAEVTDKLTQIMNEEKCSVIDLYSRQMAISKALEPYIADLFEEYGFSVRQFRIAGMALPEEDPEFIRLKKLQANKGMQLEELQLEQQRDLMRQSTESKKTMMQADAMAYKRQAEGYTYQEQKQFEVLNNIASNMGGSGSAGISSEMLQLGAGLGLMGAMGNAAGKISEPLMKAMTPSYGSPAGTENSQAAPSGSGPAAPSDGADAGTVQAQPSEASASSAAPTREKSPLEVLKELKALLDAGLIEQKDYDDKKTEILRRM